MNSATRSLQLAALIVISVTVLAGCGRSRALADEGMSRLEQGKQTSALELFDRALRSNSKEPLALYGKGMLLSEEQITEEIALSMLKQAVQQSDIKEKYRVNAYLRIAEIYARRGDKDETLQNLAKISGTGKAVTGEIVRKVATIYLLLKEKDRAREAITAFLDLNPKDEETEYFLLKLYVLITKDLKAGFRLCQKVDWQKSQSPRYLLNCSRVSAAAGEWVQAQTLIDLYIKRAGSGAPKEVNELRDAIGRKRGKFEPAATDF